MNHVWDKLSVCNAITPQLIGHNLSGLTPVPLQQPPKEAFGSPTITPSLEKYIYYFTILIDSSP